jgi:hypothetical protein
MTGPHATSIHSTTDRLAAKIFRTCCSALRRWPDRVQAYMDRVDGSLLFVSTGTHRALIQATGIALTALSVLALVAARLIA